MSCGEPLNDVLCDLSFSSEKSSVTDSNEFVAEAMSDQFTQMS